MQTLPAPFQAHLGGDVTSLVYCWSITRRDGEVLRGTAHDRDITITTGNYAGTYASRNAAAATDVASKSDGSSSNADLDGVLRLDAEITGDVTVEELESGLFDSASAVLFIVNWEAPDDGQRVLLAGTLGEFARDTDGRFRTEVRGLTDKLSQNIVRTASRKCNVVVFGDERCKFDVEAVTVSSSVAVIEDRRRFDAAREDFPDPKAPTPTYYFGGKLTFTSGANAGFSREARGVEVPEITGPLTNNVRILLWDDVPADIEVGDTFTIEPGCDRQFETCRLVHENLVNFRGYGVFAPGRAALMRGNANPVSTLHNSPWGLLTEEELDERLQELLGKFLSLV